ncbi:exopolysaccharide transport family protein [Tianweitania sp. BSSL-BM11]|uniref:Exopolysaccharide transport family protein n=1 Tax=Tianweitania aestuarii TaxID=2814886 RepID=A0ABS5RV67_9HYPH|nr:Wzz/FepE/Etk N-terminal domain-containing protein [Tianweitania aestuarii]MBS9720119.1 exopolysaccharide transport family protein [Tianweitania aestuarii]
MPVVSNQANDIDVDLGRLFASLAAHWLRILLVAVCITGLAFLLAWSATPLYRAETRILIETRESPVTRADASGGSDGPILDAEGVASQVQVISSTDILKKVAADLDLASRSEFDPSADMSLPKRILVSTGLMRDPKEVPSEERVVSAMRDKLKVYAVEGSRVIAVEFSSSDPQLAATVPNRIAEAYLSVQQIAKQQSNTNATQWLQPEIANLSERVKEAESKVAAFRAQSDLPIGQNNSVLATQQLSELSSELSRVRANRSAAEANAESLRATIQAGASLDSAPEVLSSPLIQRLREREVELKAQIADLSVTLLGNHPRLRALNSQLNDLEGQIRTEARKVLAGLETEARTAAAREASLQRDLDALKEVSARADDQQIELRSLEREAAAQRDLLESYMARYREALSRGEGNYLPADARIFQRAMPPVEPYFPKILPITIAAFVASLLIMAVITLLQELFSGRAMRRAGQGFYDVDELAMPAAAAVEAPVVVEERNGALTVQRAAAALIADHAKRAIFVSPEGDEAAAASVMVAREIADAGQRVLLLDLTASGVASQPMLDNQQRPGITNLLAAEAQFTDVIHADFYSDCHVIPVGTADPETAMRAADRLPIIMRSLASAYDLVVVECGPTDPEGIERLMGDDTKLALAMIDPADDAVTVSAEAFAGAGYDDMMLVSPVGAAAGRNGMQRSAA